MDVDGVNIPRAALTTLRNSLGVPAVEIIRCGLNRKQVKNLPAEPVSIKGIFEQKKAFKEEFGNKAYELDVIEPSDLQRRVCKSIQKYTDIELMEQDIAVGVKTKS